MAASFNDLVDQMQKAPLRRGGGNYIQGDGVYTIEILSAFRKMGFNKSFTERDQELFICEFKFVRSSNPNHPVGTTASWTLKGPTGNGKGDLKAFCFALSGIDPRAVKDNDEKAHRQAAVLSLAALGEQEAFTMAGLPEDFFVGRLVGLETKTTKTKAGTDFTKHIWSPATE
jgi:hypothetical protein